MGATRGACGFKSALHCLPLEEGLLNLQFHQLLHKKNNCSFFVVVPMYLYKSMKGYSYKLTWRLRHREIDIMPQRSKEIKPKKSVETTSECEAYITLLFLWFYLEGCNIINAYFLPFPNIKRKKTNKKPNETTSLFSCSGICFCSTLRKGKL